MAPALPPFLESTSDGSLALFFEPGLVTPSRRSNNLAEKIFQFSSPSLSRMKAAAYGSAHTSELIAKD
jgi:hypothetical protein